MEIELNNLVKTYQKASAPGSVYAVRGISLRIPSNTIFGIIGKSGAGKSTLVRLVSLLERPDSGEVRFGGVRVDDLSERELIARRRRLGMIFQNFNLFSSRNAAQNIAYPLEICGVPKAKIRARVAELLEVVGLADRAASPVSTLSGGQKQRIAIARALANSPDILFCDEATSALDPQTTLSILDLIREIQKKMSLTVVMITHQMEVVRDACRYVAVVNDGTLVESGSVEDIFMRPQSEVTKGFLAHLPQNAAERMVRWSSGGGKYTLRFYDTQTDEPVISNLVHRFGVAFNIRAAGIQTLAEHKVGTLVMDFDGSADDVGKAIAYLRGQGIAVEKEADA
ncbi:MAG: ATP-binding cassette domain-containing protein [Treponema sp.]|nr:ATP-binding cassette domain-containing protein [Treponema sp.]